MSSPELVSWSMVGAGNVGGALIDMVAKPEVAEAHGLEQQPQYVLRRDGWHLGGPEGPVANDDPFQIPESDVIFIATPSTANHEPMLTIMSEQLDRDGIVVTAEKGVLAEHYTDLVSPPGKLGYWATVGGGTKLIPKLEYDTRDPGNIKELHLATNATLTYVFSEVANGRNLDVVVDAAVKLGYAEPDATGAYNVIRNEAANDVPRKISIVLQSVFPEFAGLPLARMQTRLSEKQVLQALNEADKYRYLVSVYPESAAETARSRSEDRLGGFHFKEEGWLVIGGLQRIDRTNPLRWFRSLDGAGAGYYIDLGPSDKSTIDGENFVGGTGAGGAVTANTMLDNYDYLRQQD